MQQRIEQLRVSLSHRTMDAMKCTDTNTACIVRLLVNSVTSATAITTPRPTPVDNCRALPHQGHIFVLAFSLQTFESKNIQQVMEQNSVDLNLIIRLSCV